MAEREDETFKWARGEGRKRGLKSVLGEGSDLRVELWRGA